ncbi:MAG: hypothetical protein ABSE22_00160 [Xanthobacteraceae bacterium]
MRWCDRLPLAALLALVLVAPGCSGGSIGASTMPAQTATAPTAVPPTAPSTATPPSAPPASPSLKDKIGGFFSSKSATAPQPVANAQPDIDCPFIDIRQGASTLTIPPPPPDGGNEAMALKYQGDFVRAARECKVVGGQMVIKIGVQGRIIVGPAGGPGQVEVPLRIAVVSAPTVGSKVIATKLIRIPVTVPPGEGNASFTHIEEGVAFPLPSAAELASYIVYIGFDPVGAAAEDQARQRPAAAPKVKPKPGAKPNPSAPTG